MATIKVKNAKITIGKDGIERDIIFNPSNIIPKIDDMAYGFVDEFKSCGLTSSAIVSFSMSPEDSKRMVDALIKDMAKEMTDFIVQSYFGRYRIACRYASRSPKYDRYRRYLEEQYGYKP